MYIDNYKKVLGAFVKNVDLNSTYVRIYCDRAVRGEVARALTFLPAYANIAEKRGYVAMDDGCIVRFKGTLAQNVFYARTFAMQLQTAIDEYKAWFAAQQPANEETTESGQFVENLAATPVVTVTAATPGATLQNVAGKVDGKTVLFVALIAMVLILIFKK